MIDYNLLTYTIKNGEPRAGLHVAERVHDLKNLLYTTEGSLVERTTGPWISSRRSGISLTSSLAVTETGSPSISIPSEKGE